MKLLKENEKFLAIRLTEEDFEADILKGVSYESVLNSDLEDVFPKIFTYAMNNLSTLNITTDLEQIYLLNFCPAAVVAGNYFFLFLIKGKITDFYDFLHSDFYEATSEIIEETLNSEDEYESEDEDYISEINLFEKSVLSKEKTNPVTASRNKPTKITNNLNTAKTKDFIIKFNNWDNVFFLSKTLYDENVYFENSCVYEYKHKKYLVLENAFEKDLFRILMYANEANCSQSKIEICILREHGTVIIPANAVDNLRTIC